LIKIKKMSALLIKTKSANNLKLLKALAKQLGGNVLSIKDEQFEDFSLGTLMNKVKTNQTVSREAIMKKLNK